MPQAPIPANDEARLAALYRYGILDQPPDDDLDAIARLASVITGAAITQVNLIDRKRQWTVAATGRDVMEMPRDESMCARVVVDTKSVYVADCGTDERFRDLGAVTGLGVRMYAGSPIVSGDGHAVGTVCAIDFEDRQLSAAQLAALDDLATQVRLQFELRRYAARLEASTEQLLHRATRDPLTGLANRELLMDALDHANSVADSHLSVLFCDLDKFKAINDTHGHAAGDEVLVAAAARLHTAVRSHDIVGRLGGDEFVVIARDLSESATAALAGRIEAAIAEPMAAGGVTVQVGASVGWFRSDRSHTAAEVLDRADRHMYEHKTSRRGADT